MKNKYKKSRLIVMTSVIVVLSLSMMYLTVSSGASIPYVSSGIQSVMTFMNNVISKPIQYLSSQKDSLSNLLSTYTENQELKATVASLEQELAETETIESENESLRASLKIEETYSDKTLIPSLVTVRTPTAWSQEISIDSGTNDGIYTGMLVMANGGVIGVVGTVEKNSATVKLLTNADDVSKIAVKITSGSSTIYGILSGYDSDRNALIITQLNSTDSIEVGSAVVSSDLAESTASNLEIGTVLQVEISTSDLTTQVYVTPSASFSNLYAVTVVGE